LVGRQTIADSLTIVDRRRQWSMDPDMSMAELTMKSPRNIRTSAQQQQQQQQQQEQAVQLITTGRTRQQPHTTKHTIRSGPAF